VLPVLAVIEDLSKAVAGSVRSLPTVFINEPELDVSISALASRYRCSQYQLQLYSGDSNMIQPVKTNINE